MIYFEDVPHDLINKIESWKSAKNKWLDEANYSMELYLNDVDETGTTYNYNQVEKIKANTNIPVSINYLYPVVAQKMAIILASKPSHKVIALDERAKQYAYILDKVKHAIMYSSESMTENEEAIKEMLVSGISHVGIVEKDLYNLGEFEISYQHFSYNNITIDPNSRKKNNADMEGFVHEKELNEDQIKFLYDNIINSFNTYYETNHTYEELLGNSTNLRYNSLETIINKRKALVRKYYDKVASIMYYVENPVTKDIERLFKENYFPEQVEIIFDSKYVKKEEPNFYVREMTIVGNKILEIRILPLTIFPIKTLYFEWGGKPYRSFGMVHFTKGMQEAMDKSLQLMILNGILTNNAGWIAPKGSIAEEDRSKWEQSGNDPRVIKEYVPNVIDNQVLRPEREPIGQLSNFYPTIIDIMKNGIENSTGINPMIQGDPRGAKVDVFSSLQAYQNAGMQRINMTISSINNAMETVGKILIQYILANLKPNTNYQFFNDKGKLDELKISQDIMNNIKTVNFDVLAIPAESSPTQKLNMAIEMMKIAQTTPDPTERSMFIKKAFELSDIRGFDEMSEELDEVKKLQQQLSQMQQQIERDNELIKQYENKALNAEYRAKLAEMISKATDTINSETVKVKGDIKIEKLNEQLKEAKKEDKKA